MVLKSLVKIALAVVSVLSAHLALAQADSTKLMAMLGKKAPDFQLPDLEWNQVELSDLENKVILIDFWASWCRYCRKFNVELVELYEIYNDDGLEIVSVSLDYDYYKWKNAVRDDGLTWINLNDREGLESEIAAEYHIIHTPTTFLLNQDKIIEAIDYEGDQLESKIKELLDQK